MRLAGLLNLPLYLAPYKLPAPFNGASSFDAQALEPFLQTRYDTSNGYPLYYQALATYPFDFGWLNINNGAPLNTGLRLYYDGAALWSWAAHSNAPNFATYEFSYAQMPQKGGVLGQYMNNVPITWPFGSQTNGVVPVTNPDAQYIFPLNGPLIIPSPPNTQWWGRSVAGLWYSYNDFSSARILYPDHCTFADKMFSTPGNNIYQELSGSVLIPNRQGLYATAAAGYPGFRFAPWAGAGYSGIQAGYLQGLTIEDDTILNNVMQLTGGAWAGHMLTLLSENDARITGQNFIPFILDPYNNRYWIIRFVPHSKEAQQLLTDDGTHISIKYSANGYFMLIDAAPTHQNQGNIFHTYELSLDGYPELQFAAQTISLPCYNPCVPNIVQGNQ